MSLTPRPSRAAADGPRLLRVHPWGQLSLLASAGGERPQLVWELQCAPDRQPAALALADAWRQNPRPGCLDVVEARIGASRSGGRPALLVTRTAPRGPRLDEVVRKSGPITPAQAAMLVFDLVTDALALHARGLVVGEWSPAELVLCPPGAEDQAALTAVQAGLDSLLAVAGGLESLDDQGLPWQTPALVAPEVLAGQAPTPASDVYAICALLAWLLTGRHVSSASSLTQLRVQTAAGGHELGPALQQAAPELAPLLLQGLAVSHWQRAGVLQQLHARLQADVADRPTLALGERTVLAAWGMGSPLVPLAAYAQGGGWLEHPPGQAVALPSSVPSGLSPVAAPAHLAAPDRARLQAALDSLDAERIRGQQQSRARGERWQARLVLATVALFALLGLLAWGLRQTREVDPADAAAQVAAPRVQRPIPPRPKPIDLTPENQP